MKIALKRYLLGMVVTASLLILFTPFLLVVRSFSSNNVESGFDTEQGLGKLEDLQEQLEKANLLHRTYKAELVALKDQLQGFLRVQHGSFRNNSFGQNLSMALEFSPVQSSITSYLPHLANNMDALIPAVHFSGKRRNEVSFVLAIPTVKRDETSYLLDTLRSLVSGLSDEDASDVLIVIMVGDLEGNYADDVIAMVKQNLPEAVSSGLIEVIAPKSSFYPDLTRLKPTFGDPPERLQWRTKQVLDFVYLMMYCRTRGVYYLQLEDDIIAKANYIGEVRRFMTMQNTDEWFVLEFSSLGFIGKLFRSVDLYALCDFFLMFFKDKPVDWLLDGFLGVKACNPEKDNKHCAHEKQLLRRRMKPSLFQHVGMKSSLKGKIQKLKDKEFGKGQLFIPHENPSAVVSTTLKEYQDFRIDLAYAGSTHFWALLPQANDTIVFEFSPPVRLERFYLKSGNAEHVEDRFYDTAVEMKFVGDITSDMKQVSGYKLLPDDFYTITNFDKYDFLITIDLPFLTFFKSSLGVATSNITIPLPVAVARIRVLRESQFWVVLSEIHFKPLKS